jgi:phosphate transport system permease protein
MKTIFWASGIFTVFLLILVIGYILVNGLPVINLNFIFGQPIDNGAAGGILPFIISTIYVTFVALVVATPLGVAEYAGENALVKAIRFGSEILASIPSIVFGLFGFAFFVVYLDFGFSVLSGGLTLALMAMPTILRTAEVAIESVPKSYSEGSMALGASKWQTISQVILPAAVPGIITGVILGMARAVEETAAILYTVGAAIQAPVSIFDPGQPLPLHLYTLATEGISMPFAYGTAAVLVILILVITIVTNTLVDRYTKKMMGR